jgi:hypothetical protein
MHSCVHVACIPHFQAKKLVAELQALNDDVGQRTLRSSATSGESLGKESCIDVILEYTSEYG